jgi:hypothetical protein
MVGRSRNPVKDSYYCTIIAFPLFRCRVPFCLSSPSPYHPHTVYTFDHHSTMSNTVTTTNTNTNTTNTSSSSSESCGGSDDVCCSIACCSSCCSSDAPATAAAAQEDRVIRIKILTDSYGECDVDIVVFCCCLFVCLFVFG